VATEGPLGWSALRAARRLGIPAATGLHTRFDQYMRSYGLGLLEDAALRWMRRFHAQGTVTLVPTRELADLLARRGFAHVERLPRTVDCARFTPASRDPGLRRTWGLGPRDVAVLHFGRLAPEKNLGLAVRAFHAIAQHWAGPGRVRMVWVGDGPERGALEAAHPDHVFCGLRTDAALARHVASCDLFLFPSTSETFGNVVLEAMACGVPTVAFDRGAAREHLRHGIDGACVDDDAAFVREAVRIALDDDRRLHMGAAARAAMEALDGDAMVGAYEAALMRIARAAKPELPRLAGVRP
jgi:glycosyltransferase involved in cell wall biosynthesis